MYALLNFFVDLCLLRVAPQALPASGVLFGMTLAINLLVSLLLLVGAPLNPGTDLLQSLAELLLGLLALGLALRIRGHPARFHQTATALMGSGALLGLLALPALGSGQRQGELAVLGFLWLLGLTAWSLVVAGHILRHALDLSLGEGVTLALLFTLISYALLGVLFPGG